MIRGASAEFVLERRREEAQLSKSKPTAGHLKRRDVVAADQLKMDRISTLATVKGGMGGIAGRVVGHTVGAGGTAAIRRVGREGSRGLEDND